MQVAPATVAMENTLAAEFPAIFMCLSLSSGVSLASRHSQLCTRQAPLHLCQDWLFLAWEVLEDPKVGVQGSTVGVHGMGGAGERCCARLIG